MINWLTTNYTTLIYIIIFGCCIGLAFAYPKKIKKLLLYAVTVAESDLGNGTGAIKLVKVYDYFTNKCPIVSTIIPYELFSRWVDTALKEMKEQLEKNNNIKTLVDNGEVK
ncbi:hypothetical protein [Clostridium sp.]|jgi:hypothetical protein|uniref:hypothetical protein n=1 Tax=Clostridium sp. TaxID=1506 RepID=UPI0025C1BFB3|nr:hypothetical protein [Clostridium sp.]